MICRGNTAEVVGSGMRFRMLASTTMIDERGMKEEAKVHNFIGH